MAHRKQRTTAQPTLTLLPAPTAAVDPEVTRLADELAARIASLATVSEQAAALNAARQALHAVSPFASEPVDCVLWVPEESVRGNTYNPNKVAPPEMELLRRSIFADGFTQPIVTWPVLEPAGYEVVDGFHRSRVGREDGPIRARVHGHLPVTMVAQDRTGANDRIAATIRHNRARGVHGVDPMSDIVRVLYEQGWPDDKIQEELGMETDEVTRLKQLTGLAALFKDRVFSEAWEVSDKATQEETP